MDCTGKAERFCVKQGVREFPGVMLVVDGEAKAFEGGHLGKPSHFERRSSSFLVHAIVDVDPRHLAMRLRRAPRETRRTERRRALDSDFVIEQEGIKLCPVPPPGIHS